MTDSPALRGELLVEDFAFDGGRRVEVYVPSAPAEGILFTGDGHATADWARALDGVDALALMIVGIHARSDEMERIHEYSPGFAPETFAAHERFVIGEVREWISTRFGPDVASFGPSRTAFFGASAGGELALALGLRHPDVFGAILCASPGGGYQPPQVLPTAIPRTYLVAGTEEPFFLVNATRWAQALRDAGADVVLAERAGEHGGAFWGEELPAMVDWAFERPA